MQRKATKVQKIMITLMGGAFGLLAVWAVPEIMGVLSPATEDTYSEWVWDLHPYFVMGIAALHATAGVMFVWSAGHFIEGWRRRHGRKKP